MYGKKPPKTAAQRQASRDARLRKEGKVQRRVWAHPSDWPAIKLFVQSLDESHSSGGLPPDGTEDA